MLEVESGRIRKVWLHRTLWEYADRVARVSPPFSKSPMSFSKSTQKHIFDLIDDPDEADRIENADLRHPIIMQDNWVVDGYHRIAKAWLDDTLVLVVKVPDIDDPSYPPPDLIEEINL